MFIMYRRVGINELTLANCTVTINHNPISVAPKGQSRPFDRISGKSSDSFLSGGRGASFFDGHGGRDIRFFSGGRGTTPSFFSGGRDTTTSFFLRGEGHQPLTQQLSLSL